MPNNDNALDQEMQELQQAMDLEMQELQQAVDLLNIETLTKWGEEFLRQHKHNE